MANEKHVTLLKQGKDTWNHWRQRNSRIIPDLNGADLDGLVLGGVDLRHADLSRATLRKADFSATSLIRPTVFESFEMSGGCSTNLSFANLSCADLRQTNFRLADLSNTNLRQADLAEANFLMSNLSGADLTDANLTRIQALNTNFNAAILSGACIQEWNINSETNLDSVICDYVYRLNHQQERLPIERNFVSGEFTRLFQKSSSIIELIFNDGVDWISFAFSFRKLRIEHEESELVVESIENKGDGTVVVKVKVPSVADKTTIYYDFMQGYNLAQKTLGEQYHARLKEKDKHINQLFLLLQDSQERLGEVPKLIMADTPPRIINTSTYNEFGTVNAQNFVQGDYINMSQDLNQAASQIQDLIEQLQKRGATVDVAQKQVAQDIVIKAQGDPKLKDKLIRWGQSLGDATVSDVVKGAVKLAIRSAGIPLP